MRQQPHERERGHRLAGPAFADEPEDLARRDGQIDIAQDRHAVDGEREVADRKQAHAARLSRGSR